MTPSSIGQDMGALDAMVEALETVIAAEPSNEGRARAALQVFKGLLRPAAKGFLDAILERTPNGEWIAVQYHPDGDWSVAHSPTEQTNRLEGACPDCGGEGHFERQSGAAPMRVEYCTTCDGTGALAQTTDDRHGPQPPVEGKPALTIQEGAARKARP